MNEMDKEDLKKAYWSEKDPKIRARIPAVHMVSVCEESIGKTATNLMQSERWVRDRLKRYDEGGRVKALVRPEELPAILGDDPVDHDSPVASGVRHDYPLSARGPIFASGYHIVDKEGFVLVHYGESVSL